MEAIYYFTAFAVHLDQAHPGDTLRHRVYVECLEAAGVHVCAGRIKTKTLSCPHCRRRIIRHEEKETDVAIATYPLQLLHASEPLHPSDRPPALEPVTMARSSIEWTQTTWNPLTGCTKVSPGCTHCYAERMARRLKAMGQRNYVHGFQLTLHEHALDIPLRLRKPQTIFVNSMSDLFHEDVPEAFIQRVFAIMRQAHRHRFQVLTKRAERLEALSTTLRWPDNVWMGVSVESPDYVWRIDRLRRTRAKIKFLSMEPLLAGMPDLDLTNIDWVIVGGESGPGARAISEDWVLGIRDHCHRAAVPFFFKQWGGVWKKRNGRLLGGRTWDEMPRAAAGIGPTPALAERKTEAVPSDRATLSRELYT